MDAARVRFLVRPTGWTAWEALMGDAGAQALDLAGAEYGDDRLVAAYVLETVCADARRKAAQAAVEAGPQTKSFEVPGDYKEEYFAPVTSADVATADEWCNRAAVLRAEAVGNRIVQRQRSVVYQPEQDRGC